MQASAKALHGISKQYNVSSATLAVAWVLKSTYRTTPIISSRKSGQLSPVIDALDFDMSEDLLAEINEV